MDYDAKLKEIGFEVIAYRGKLGYGELREIKKICISTSKKDEEIDHVENFCV